MRKYAKTHEWYEDLGAGKVKIGISKHAAHELSDIVFVELPDVGKKLSDKQSVCVLESVKAVADVYSPGRDGRGGERQTERYRRPGQPGPGRGGLAGRCSTGQSQGPR